MAEKPTYDELSQKLKKLERELSRHRKDISSLEADHNRLEAILESAIHAIIVVNEKGQIIKWSGQAELLCGWSREEVIGKPVFMIMPARHREMHKEFMQHILGGQRGSHFAKRIETNILYRDEFEVPVELSISMTGGINGEREFAVFMHDITERKSYEAQLHHMSVTDELTGLFNRRGFKTLADKQLKVAARNKHEVFLLYADFDNMKWINDKYGHPAGDSALVETAVILKNTFRQADLIGRVGGDEFIVLLSDRKGRKSEETVIDRLEEEINKANSIKNRRYKILLSIGTVSCDSANTISIDELMIKADKLMYESKRQKKESGNYTHF